jgi:hypothetical protein
VKDFVDDPRQLENWRYPLTIATANFNNEVVSQLLIPIAEKYPAFAAEIVMDSSTRWGSNEISLPTPYQCGKQIQTAMQAWVKGIGTLAKLIAPIQQDGTLRAIGVRTDGARLEAAWHSGSEERNIVDLPLDWMSPNSQERNNWISGKGSRPGHESAWAWRWTLDELIHNLSRQLQYPILPVDSEPIICEAAWRAAISIIRYRQNLRLTKLNHSGLDEVTLGEIEETLCEIEAQSKLNCFITLPGIGSQAKVQDYYLKQLRKQVDRIQGLGELVLQNPWQNLNRTFDKRHCKEYNLEQLRITAEQIYKAALDAYQQITNTWFKQLIPGMYIAAMLPARLVGVIAPHTSSEEPENFGNSIDFDLFIEALPENAQNEAEITIGNIIDVVITEDHPLIKANNHRINLANQQLSLLRPKSAVWIKSIPERWGCSKELFHHSPATALAYSWLREDLTKIFGFGNFPRQTYFG